MWSINAYIPLKDEQIVEMVRGTVLWILWLEWNKLCFQNSSKPTIQVIGAKIIAMASFWCKTLSGQSFWKLSLILPLDVTNLHTQDLMIPSEEEDLTEEEVEVGYLLSSDPWQ